MMKYLLIGLAGLALTACATTDSSDSAAAMPAGTAGATLADGELDPNAEVCRTVQQSGTRFRARVCKTRAEWARQAEEAQQATRNMQRTVEPNRDGD